MGIEGVRAFRKSYNSETKKTSSNPVIEQKSSPLKPLSRELPVLVTSKIKALVSLGNLDNQIKIIKKGHASREAAIFYYPRE